ncbi:TetR/AcrR family transcriptional regulator [Pseudomonas sp. BGr12]|uniref:TetR/AcrR family transcriptional regulator n=1 Tax=Pseudomonas nitroreducens TaxID=46680 RepID=A0A5R9AKA6_PSENT|nr:MULTISPECIES: TetR/AcrR family transcriptional regulator [Pseudomonas]MBD9503603.1 TetR/AcrR family transcriptional regulator [Pseudomonas sp. PDM17]MBD9574086.1 TetR/AcrR family transcriptional regulator [Pseudomonas sp. PDM23]MBD9671924.1 TetR/AcrR family transcriptional regulator [Pseudomonas sp. PDM21]MDL2425546.1 TetR/AcrR family transcriptional regulator [Pseudomonas sp. BJa5]TLP78377.1 TetR/AcrR family transcriptional regulator [Pseudomonas nitroreducens]
MSPTNSSNGPGRPKDPAKRKAILEAAKELFVRYGYDGSSMEAIAAEAGVSKLTVYSHFTDKETLFVEAVQAKCAERMPELFAEPPADAPLESLLLNLGRGFNQLINSPEAIALSRLMVAQGAGNPHLSQLFFEAGPQRVLDQMERLLEQARQQGKMKMDCPRRAAEHFLMLVQGCVHFRLMIGCENPPTPEESEAHVQEVVALFLRAFAP